MNPIHPNARHQAIANGRVRTRRSRSVDSSAPPDGHDLCRRTTPNRLDADNADVKSVCVEQTGRHISQSYVQHVITIQPFGYRLVDTSAQHGIAHASALGNDLITEVISSPISPPNSPVVTNSNPPTTNHTGPPLQVSATLNGTHTRPTTKTGSSNNINKNETFYHGRGHHLTTKPSKKPRPKASRLSNAQDRQLSTCIHHMRDITPRTNREQIDVDNQNHHIVPSAHSTITDDTN